MADNYNYHEPEEEIEVKEEIQTVSKSKNRGFAVASLICGIVSVVCCVSWWLSLVCGIAGIVFSIISKKKLDYFDGLSLAGLICGIIGAVIALTIGITSTWFPYIWNFLEESIEYIQSIRML